MAQNAQIKVRRDTAATWTSVNPVLAAGEPGYETNTSKIKYGDGTTAWASLAYVGSSGSYTPPTGTGYPHITAGVQDGAADTTVCSIGLAAGLAIALG